MACGKQRKGKIRIECGATPGTKPTKFFIPAARNVRRAEAFYESIKKLAKETTGGDITPRRIFAIAYEHDGRQCYAEVGKPEPREGELVIAILETNATPYLICTPNRGVLQGMPYFVRKEEVLSIVDFVT
jgi:hypothetical protein